MSHVATCRSFTTLWAALAVAIAPRIALATDRDTIGYTALVARPGALLANGAGVTVAQVEATPTGSPNYSPDTTSVAFAGKTFTFRSGATGVSPHASQVASLYYGNALSPAPSASNVVMFSARSFVEGLLRMGQPGRAPGAVKAEVVSNSWLAGFSTLSPNADVLHRLDDLINRDDLLVFNAVDNVAANAFPKLMASAYNGITVGTTDGSHGPFAYDAPGPRIKPDLIVNAGLTSNATALASGSGALLRSEAKARGISANEVAIKAILMAGAHRDATWRRGRASGSDNATAPLDFQQGAGQLRVDQSFDILTAGKHAPGVVTSADAGWDFARTPRKTSQDTTYYLRVTQALPKWDVMLTWNRVIDGYDEDANKYSTKATVADFALTLYLQRKGGRRLVARSDSPYDNVESLTLANLTPGTYQMVLETDRRSRYAIAWYGGDEVDGTGMVAMASSAVDAGMSHTGDFDAVALPEPAGWIGALALSRLFAPRSRRRPRARHS